MDTRLILGALAVALAGCAGDASEREHCTSRLNLGDDCDGTPPAEKLRADGGAPDPDTMGTRWTCRCYELDARGMQPVTGTPRDRAQPRVCATSRAAAFDTARRMCGVGTPFGCVCGICCPDADDERGASSLACVVDPELECGEQHWDGASCPAAPAYDGLACESP